VVAAPASAQIGLPGGVALSPIPVLQSPPSYPTFNDGQGGVWGVFLGTATDSPLDAQHLRTDGSYDMGFGPSALALTDVGTLANSCSAAADGTGGAAILWFGVNAKDPTSPYLALRYTHLEPGGTIATGLPDTGLVVSNISSAALLVGDGVGGAYIVWEEVQSGSNPDLFAQHYDYHGNALWTPSGSVSGRTLCSAVGIQHIRSLVPDGAGGAYAVWADSRSGTGSPLYAARLVPGGIAGGPWPTNGLRVTPITTGIRIVGTSTSSTSGLLLAWRDINLPAQFNAQHVSPDGLFLWTSLGAIVATVTPARADFVPGSNGRVFVTWGGSDIRCSCLDAAGSRVWATEPAGRVLVTAPNGSAAMRAVTDDAGGQRLAWAFDNAGQSDVYLLRVDGTGAPAAGEVPGGQLFEGGAATQVPVNWLLQSGAAPLVVWLDNGQLRVRRMPGPSLGVGPALAPGTLALAPPAPNPFRGGTLLARFAASAGEASLALYDVSGRRVAVHAVRSAGGSQTVTLDGLAGLAPGVYTLRLESGVLSTSQRLVRVR
jgi:hypothetical protein